MAQVPNIFSEGRRLNVTVVSLAGIGEAMTIGLVAFSMRDIFSALHAKEYLPAESLVILMLAGVIVAALRVLSRTQAERLGQSYAISLRSRLYRHFAGQPHSRIAERRAGALGLRFVGDLSAARSWSSLGLTRVISACFVLPGAVLALVLLNPALAAAAAIPIFLAIVTMALLSIYIEPLHRKIRSKRAGIAISMMERVPIAPELDLLGRSPREIKALNRKGSQLSEMAVDRMKIVTWLRVSPEIGMSLAIVAILYTTSNSGGPAAEAAAAIAVLGILAAPLRELAGVWDRYCAWRVAREKCEVVFASPSTRHRMEREPGPVAVIFDEICFRDLSANASISPGETALISGPVGSGKSTLLSLAAGLESPDIGCVRYSTKSGLPRTLIIKPSAPILQGSLRRALTIGAIRRMDDPVIQEAADRFGFDLVINRLGGLSARIGENGRTLSDGEKILLLIIRAYLTQPNLLLVDAPLVGIDDTLRHALKTVIAEIGMTTLIASVDGGYFGFADRHLYFDEGQLTELVV
ncbi:MAG: ABC transporter ATP-binding protein, partial [Gammaproteobacteria bacterium]|nr:ABC transporter ATP-binding protein [Gammaproteobacteria bacterium]